MVDRGWNRGPNRRADLILVPQPPNYMGTLVNTSHSGPYGFLQRVPLTFYGPGFIEPRGRFDPGREVTIADLAPTYAQLIDFEWGPRDAAPVTEVLNQSSLPPRIIVTVSVDGGGWNVLERWPGSWPHLKRLMERGANVDNATVGSSPSITPATHTNISTGTFPRRHGVTAIAVRSKQGRIVGAFSESAQDVGPDVEPTINLRHTTIGDDWDREMNNQPLVGMVTSGNYTLGMLGAGAAVPGGDKDILAMIDDARKGKLATDEEFYSLPEYIHDVPGPQRELDLLDRSDGQADGRWRGHDLDTTAVGNTPAVAEWEFRVMQTILQGEGFGDDHVTDLFFAHFKSPDHVGHRWNMISPEMGDVVASVDAAIGRLASWLDENVGEDSYVLVVTADHGQTPLEAGGWPISRREILNDIHQEFDKTPNGRGIVERTSATSFFMNQEEMRANKVTPGQVASFLSDYTIGDNIADGGDLPEGFEERAGEQIFRAVFPGGALDKVVECSGA